MVPEMTSLKRTDTHMGVVMYRCFESDGVGDPGATGELINVDLFARVVQDLCDVLTKDLAETSRGLIFRYRISRTALMKFIVSHLPLQLNDRIHCMWRTGRKVWSTLMCALCLSRARNHKQVMNGMALEGCSLIRIVLTKPLCQLGTHSVYVCLTRNRLPPDCLPGPAVAVASPYACRPRRLPPDCLPSPAVVVATPMRVVPAGCPSTVFPVRPLQLLPYTRVRRRRLPPDCLPGPTVVVAIPMVCV